MSVTERLRSPAPPWVHLLVLRGGTGLPAAPDGFVARVVAGDACVTKSALMVELARVLEFPSYFGRNWDALHDCLTDLAWLPAPGYTLLFTDAHAILRRRPADYRTFLDVLASAGESWATPQAQPDGHPAIPFHSVLAVPEERTAARRDWRMPELTDI